MAVLDWIFLAVLLLSVAIGALRGLVYEVVSVLGWVAAFVVAQMFAPEAAALLPMGTAAEPLRYAAGFVLVFVAVAFASGLVAWVTRKMVESIGLRPVDRTLGGAFGLLRGIVVLLAMAVVVEMTQLKTNDRWQESKGAAVLTVALKGLKPVLPEQFGKYLP